MNGSHVPVTLHVPVNGTSQEAGNSGAQCVVHTAAGLQQGASLQSGGSEHAGPVVVVVLIVEVVLVVVVGVPVGMAATKSSTRSSTTFSMMTASPTVRQ